MSSRFTRLARDKRDVTVADITRLYVDDEADLRMLRRALELEALPNDWHEYFREQVTKLETQGRAV